MTTGMSTGVAAGMSAHVTAAHVTAMVSTHMAATMSAAIMMAMPSIAAAPAVATPGAIAAPIPARAIPALIPAIPVAAPHEWGRCYGGRSAKDRADRVFLRLRRHGGKHRRSCNAAGNNHRKFEASLLLHIFTPEIA